MRRVNLPRNTGRTTVGRADDAPVISQCGRQRSWRAGAPRGSRVQPRPLRRGGRAFFRRPCSLLGRRESALGPRPWRRPSLLSLPASGRRRSRPRRRPPVVPIPSAKVSQADTVRSYRARPASRPLARRRGVSRLSRALPPTWTPTRPWCGACSAGIARPPCGTRARCCPSSGRSLSSTRFPLSCPRGSSPPPPSQTWPALTVRSVRWFLPLPAPGRSTRTSCANLVWTGRRDQPRATTAL